MTRIVLARRDWILGAIAIIAAAVCIRLGFWQLHRLSERRTKNALVVGRTTAPVLSAAEARVMDTTALHWRHLRLRGVMDYQHERVLATRSQAGSVGVQLVTPIRPLDQSWGDTAVLVIRGWMPAPDGRTFDARGSAEGDTVEIDGLITEFEPARKGAVRLPSAATAFRWLDRDTLTADLGYPVAPFVLLQLGDTVQRDVSKPVRVPPPSITEGPHKSYALQWFAFAGVALVGFGAFVSSKQRKAPGTRDVGGAA